jgi:hypothetical protein
MSGGSRSSNIKASFYCDEAGNTGPDYMHRDQPVYVLAGVLVPSAKRLFLRTALRNSALSTTKRSTSQRSPN